MPGSCYLCHGRSNGSWLFCDACARDLGPDTNKPQVVERGLDGILHDSGAVDEIVCLWPYRFPTDRLMLDLKYKNQLLLARELGHRLADHVEKSAVEMPDYLVAVPLHPLRLFFRGYNQAVEISRHLGRRLALPQLHGAVSRDRNTRPQFELAGRERRANLKGAFSYKGNLQGLHLAIVDDIVTTGHTAMELATQLKLGGALKVSLWTCAQAHSKGS